MLQALLSTMDRGCFLIKEWMTNDAQHCQEHRVVESTVQQHEARLYREASRGVRTYTPTRVHVTSAISVGQF